MENNEDLRIITKLMMSLCDDIHTVATRENKKKNIWTAVETDLSLMTEEKTYIFPLLTPGRVKT